MNALQAMEGKIKRKNHTYGGKCRSFAGSTEKGLFCFYLSVGTSSGGPGEGQDQLYRSCKASSKDLKLKKTTPHAP